MGADALTAVNKATRQHKRQHSTCLVCSGKKTKEKWIYLFGLVKIEVPESPSEQPESFCRFCFSREDLTSIFPTNGDPAQRIIDLLKQLTGICLTVGCDFPSAICRGCYHRLEEFDQFRRKCKIYSDEVTRVRLGSIADTSVVVKYENIAEKDEILIKLEHGGEAPAAECLLEETPDSVFGNGVSAARSTVKALKYGPSERKPKIKSATRTGDLMHKLKRNVGLIRKKVKKQNLEFRDYRCKVCEEFFTNKESINFHMKKHIDSVNFRCCNCQKTANSFQGIMNHAQRNYIMSSFPCQNCGLHSKSREKCLAHELYCDKKVEAAPVVAKAAQCHICPKSFDTVHKLQHHMIIHETKFHCDKCGIDLVSAVYLKKHMDRYHSQGPEQIASTVTCEPCQRSFVDASAYRSHHTRFHDFDGNQVSRQLDTEKLYECDHCGKKFWSINTIRYHVLAHRRFRDCDQCTESFRSNKELRVHKMNMHPVSCEFCPRKFYGKMGCRSHCNQQHGMLQIKQMTEDDRIEYVWRKIVYNCAYCEHHCEKFPELEDHYTRMHPGTKVLVKCNYCNMNSKSKNGYVGHLTKNCGQTPKRLAAWN